MSETTSGHCDHGNEEQRLKEQAERLANEGHHLRAEARELDEQGRRLEEEAARLAREAEHHHHDCGPEPALKIEIFVNRMKFGESAGVRKEMTADAIAALVGGNTETHTVRRLKPDGHLSDPLKGEVHLKNGDQFTVTRKHVDGGLHGRLEAELARIRESTQVVEYVPGPPGYVIYRALPALGGKYTTDVLVQVPSGYPAAMLDRAALPVDSPMLARVKGQPQETVNVAGTEWRLVSYHPHNGGGGLPWDPARHGFDTYIGEVLAWLEVTK